MTNQPNTADHDAADPSAAVVHLVHHYRVASDFHPDVLEHDSTEAFYSLTDAQACAAGHGEDVDTVPVKGMITFTAEELSTIATVLGEVPQLMDLAPATVQAFAAMRLKAASLAFLGVLGDG
jgi:hypothetical protein